MDAIGANDRYVYVGGQFTEAGGVPARNLARWDRTTGDWSALAPGLTVPPDRQVYEIAAGEGETVYVSGEISVNGDEVAIGVAEWNGEVWQRLRRGLGSGGVGSLLPMPDTLFGAGRIDTLGSRFVGIVRWTENTWEPHSAPLHGERLIQIDSDGKDGFYAIGEFFPGTDSSASVAHWSGGRWRYLDSRIEGNYFGGPELQSLAVHGDTVFVAGMFDKIDGTPARRVAMWDGYTWKALGKGLNAVLLQIAIDDYGRLYAKDQFGNLLSVWDGEKWSPFTSPLPYEITSLVTYGTEVFVGGHSGSNDVTPFSATHLHWFDGIGWRGMGNERTNGVSGDVFTLTATRTDVYAGGAFDFAGTAYVRGIGRFDGRQWHALGDGVDGSVASVAVADGGVVYAGGLFSKAGRRAARNVARWDGAAWLPLGRGVDGWVKAVAVHGSDLYVGGQFSVAYNDFDSVRVSNLARWDGQRWHDVGGGVPAAVAALLVTSGGTLYAGGYFTEAGNPGTSARHVAQWDGTTWSGLGDGLDQPVFALTEYDGVLYAGSHGMAASWDSNVWRPLGGFDAEVLTLSVSDDGLLYAAGLFRTVGGVSVYGVAQWDGASWSAVDGGVDGYHASSLAIQGKDVFVGGRFYAAGGALHAGGVPAANFAQWSALGTPAEEEQTTPAHALRSEPNPFRYRTTIRYTLPASGWVRLAVYDLLGREVTTLVNAVQEAGAHKAEFFGEGLPSGLYYCRLANGRSVSTSPMMLLR